MKHILTILCLLCFNLLKAQNDTLINLHSKILNQDRQFWVSLPSDYEANKSKRYDLIFIFDAQFKPYLDLLKSTLEFKNTTGIEYIIVGDISPYIEGKYNRNNDLLPDIKDTSESHRRAPYFGNAFQHLDYLQNELVPFLDKNFRTTSYRIAIGHSNGGSFLLNAFIRNPKLFQAGIAISPNMACDKEQLIKDFTNFHLTNKRSLILYTSQSNESKSSGFNGWDTAFIHADIVFNKLRDSNFVYQHDRFPQLNHGTTFPDGLDKGLKFYFDNLFSSEQLVLNYLDMHPLNQTPDIMNDFAYQLKGMNKLKYGLTILLIANKKFPDNLNLYDSLGEFYQDDNDNKNAHKYYTLFKEKLEKSKKSLTNEEYQKLSKQIANRFEQLKINK